MDLKLDGIGKRYGTLWVLEHIDITVKSGEFFSLLGESGSGKTTLLKCLAGIETPDQGRILFGADDITSDPMEKRPFNTVFQGYALFPHMTVFDNVAFGLRVKGVSGSALTKTVTDMVDRVGLTSRIAAYPAQLSGGQQQRVAIARVLVCEPEVILFDEPLSALDAALRAQMQRFLKELHRDLGLTFIFVTHDQDEAISLSDRICVLNDGRIEQVDTPDTLYHQPKTRFVADFIGINNLIPVDANGMTEFGATGNACANGGTLAIRPETVQINAAPSSLRTDAVLIDRRFHGDNTVMTFRAPSGREIIARRPGRGESLSIGEQASLSFSDAGSAFIAETAE